MTLIAVTSVLACVLALAVMVLVWSAGRPQPYLDDSGTLVPDSISEKIRVHINGVEQGMFIKSRRASHPVLLYLHGGIPDYFLIKIDRPDKPICCGAKTQAGVFAPRAFRIQPTFGSC
jgi:hypothetical protein